MSEKTCHICSGKGSVLDDVVCNGCSGNGWIKGNGADKRTYKCQSCHGNGKIKQNIRCKNCKGTGKLKEGVCFITTATLTALNKGDKCIELQTFREFRDSYLKEYCPQDIEDYYEIAPTIVNVINKQSNHTENYLFIWNTWLSLAYHLILEGKKEQAHKVYKKMVETLRVQFVE